MSAFLLWPLAASSNSDPAPSTTCTAPSPTGRRTVKITLDLTESVKSFDAPYGCLWCGTAQDRHGRRWAPALSDTHTWEKPDQATILNRMLRRRSARLTAEPVKYHATTAWAADHTGESADPYCADCKTDACHRWARIQTRLDQQRWGLPRRTRRSRKAVGSGWGGDQPWPF